MSHRFQSVWDAISDTPAEAKNMKLRSYLMTPLEQHIRAEGLTQKEAARKFAVTQPHLQPHQGRINLFPIGTLVNMLATAGLHIGVKIAAPALLPLPQNRQLKNLVKP